MPACKLRHQTAIDKHTAAECRTAVCSTGRLDLLQPPSPHLLLCPAEGAAPAHAW
jgi:hypothetical protein